MTNQLICGYNVKVVSPWKSNCVDGIVTDPPYELGFMGKNWDSSGIAFSVPMWRQMLRVTKPGGFLLCFGGTRTYHRLACAIEDAGWEIRDCMMWLYGSGFPKSHNISKAIDKAKGAERKDLGESPNWRESKHDREKFGSMEVRGQNAGRLTQPTTDLAHLWDGYGTALKPAWEPIIVAMKPLDGTFAHNAEAHGVAGLNIDAARIGTEKRFNQKAGNPTDKDTAAFRAIPNPHNYQGSECQGRWPANLVLDEEAGAMLDEQTGTRKSGFMSAGTKRQMSDNPNKNTYGKFNPDTVRNDTYGDIGGASRFFYCAKTSRKERNMGMGDSSGKKVNDGRQTPSETIRQNIHPTVKPLALMKYLCTLLKMPSASQIILDPFMGSGTTGMACASLGIGFIGIEKEPDYCEISSKRISSITGKPLPVTKNVETVRATKDFAGGSRRPNENLPRISELRQSLIDAASAELRRKRK